MTWLCNQTESEFEFLNRMALFYFLISDCLDRQLQAFHHIIYYFTYYNNIAPVKFLTVSRVIILS